MSDEQVNQPPSDGPTPPSIGTTTLSPDEERQLAVQSAFWLTINGYIPSVWFQESAGHWIGVAVNVALHKAINGGGPTAHAVLAAMVVEAQRQGVEVARSMPGHGLTVVQR